MPPIQMTRAEYEATYGEPAPSVASAPIRMTRAEYEATYGEPAPSAAPSLLKTPIDALTSADWWLTRPDGSKGTWAEGVSGPALAALQGLSLGYGDEIVGGGNALIDALGGRDLAESYDSRLQQARAERQRFKEQSPVADVTLQLAGALKLPFGSSVKEADTLKTTALKLAAEGGVLSAAQGFGEGEGGLENRLKSAANAGAVGAVMSPAIGVPLKALSAAKGALNREGERSIGRSIGARQSDYAKTVGDISPVEMLGDEPVETLTKKAILSLEDQGALGADRVPRNMLRSLTKHGTKMRQRRENIIVGAEKRGVRLNPEFKHALAYLEEGGVEANKIEGYLERLGAIQNKMRAEGKGLPTFVEKQKEVFGSRWNPNDLPESGFYRAVYRDLKESIESIDPAIEPINKELQKVLIVEPIIKRGLVSGEAQTFTDWARQNIRTSGGTLTTPVLLGSALGAQAGGPVGAVAGAGLAAASSPRGQQIIGNQLRQYTGARTMAGARAAPKVAAPFSAKGEEKIDNIPPATNEIADQAIKERAPQVSKQEVSALVEKQHPLVRAVIAVESAGNPRAVSKKGALGLMQLMPENVKKFGIIDPFDPRENIAGGVRLLREEMDRFKDERLALAAFNAGSPRVFTAIRKAQSRNWVDVAKYLPAETRAYVGKVLAQKVA